MKYISNSSDETIELAKKIGEKLRGGELFLLEGDIGGGKTQFTKGLAMGAGIAETVISPTFTIERIYKARDLELHHFDFYRLGGQDLEMSQEVEELLNDKKNVIVAEWPNNLEFKKPKNLLQIKFSYLDENKRELEFDLVGQGLNYLLENL